jgi:hypothetical protein
MSLWIGRPVVCCFPNFRKGPSPRVGVFRVSGRSTPAAVSHQRSNPTNRSFQIESTGPSLTMAKKEFESTKKQQLIGAGLSPNKWLFTYTHLPVSMTRFNPIPPDISTPALLYRLGEKGTTRSQMPPLSYRSERLVARPNVRRAINLVLIGLGHRPREVSTVECMQSIEGWSQNFIFADEPAAWNIVVD